MTPFARYGLSTFCRGLKISEFCDLLQDKESVLNYVTIHLAISQTVISDIQRLKSFINKTLEVCDWSIGHDEIRPRWSAKTTDELSYSWVANMR